MKEPEKQAALDRFNVDISEKIADLLTEVFPVNPALERFQDMEHNAILSAMPYAPKKLHRNSKIFKTLHDYVIRSKRVGTNIQVEAIYQISEGTAAFGNNWLFYLGTPDENVGPIWTNGFSIPPT